MCVCGMENSVFNFLLAVAVAVDEWFLWDISWQAEGQCAEPLMGPQQKAHAPPSITRPDRSRSYRSLG